MIMNVKNMLFVFAGCSLLACNDAGTKEQEASETEGKRPDSPFYKEIEPVSGFGRKPKDDDVPKKRAMLFAGIDSSYAAINKLDEIKNEINAEAAVGYSAQERNVRSKSILQLNLLSNMLARRVDSSMLMNLKEHTQQLQGINNGISKNVEHLQTLTERLTRAAAILERVTNILAGCVSAGLIRPAMPAGVPPAKVKAGL